MTDDAYIATREQRAESIRNSAARLAEMCRANMPPIMIERERQMLFRKLILFPVDSDAQAACEKADKVEDELCDEYLSKTQYFKDSEPDNEC